MKDLLARYLTPDDDGRAFAEAVMLRASGALHRRRSAGETAAALPLWEMLERWARPWVIVALIGIAVAASMPVLPAAGARSGGGEMAVGADALLTASAPDADLGFSIGN
jgi:hypothetical protein